MLDRLSLQKLLPKSLEQQSSWKNSTAEFAYKTWQLIENKTYQGLATKHPITSWEGILGNTYQTEVQTDKYQVISIDGSQIYADRQSGLPLVLINTGAAFFQYHTDKSHATLTSSPAIYSTQDLAKECRNDLYSEPFVDALRTAHEFEAAIKYQTKPDCILFDGSLIFWHLGTPENPAPHAHYFAQRYIQTLKNLYLQQTPHISYISNPRSRDLIQIIVQNDTAHEEQYQGYTDAELLKQILPQNNRSTIFKSIAPITKLYPTQLHPHFFYLNLTSELARIEIPYWLTQNEAKLEQCLSILLDQIQKGQGYPLALSEAHEQAVIREADRQFFIHQIQQKQSAKLQKKHRPIF